MGWQAGLVLKRFDRRIQSLCGMLGIDRIKNPAGDLEPFNLLLNEQAKGGGEEPVVKERIENSQQKTNENAKCRFEIALDGCSGDWQLPPQRLSKMHNSDHQPKLLAGKAREECHKGQVADPGFEKPRLACRGGVGM